MKISHISIYSLVFISFFYASSMFSEISEAQEKLMEKLPPDTRALLMQRMEKNEKESEDIEDVIEDEITLIERPDYDDEIDIIEKCPECIYGYEFFKYSPTTFAPLSTVSITADYVLGPGDGLTINYFGGSTDRDEVVISREGQILLPTLGPINILGLTFKEAKEFIREKVESELIGTQVSVSLYKLRSISVYLLGEAYMPGKYTMSGLSSITNALFISGGVNKDGSLRQIKVKRNNKTIATYDFYEFLLKGSLESDIKLLDGDIIFIPFIENKVKLGGSFKRPFIYEFVEGETVSDLIDLAGGYKSGVPSSTKIELSSINPSTFSREIFYFEQENTLTRKLQDGDVINISERSGIKGETITILGEVLNPGEYSIQSNDTILDIINRAGGYTDDSFSEGAVYTRTEVAKIQKAAFERSAEQLEKTLVDTITSGDFTALNEFSLAPITSLITRIRKEEPLGRQIVNLDYLILKTDPFLNFKVQDGDRLFIPKRPFSVSVVGEVLNGATLGFDPNLSVENYIEMAGGLNETADDQRIFVILPNGQAKIQKRSLFAKNENILPGSTIVVPRDSKPYDAIKITQIVTPILADLATSAAAIAAISD